MKKNDLKSKMIVETREGELYMVVDDVIINPSGYGMLIYYNENLTFKDENYDKFTIEKVYRYDNGADRFTNNLGVVGNMFPIDLDNGYKLLWEREEPNHDMKEEDKNV